MPTASHHSVVVAMYDGIAYCNVMSCTEACKLIDLISLE